MPDGIEPSIIINRATHTALPDDDKKDNGERSSDVGWNRRYKQEQIFRT